MMVADVPVLLAVIGAPPATLILAVSMKAPRLPFLSKKVQVKFQPVRGVTSVEP